MARYKYSANCFKTIHKRIIDKVIDFDSTIKVEDLSDKLIYDRCIKCKLYSDNIPDRYAMLYISILVPFCVFYEAVDDTSDFSFDDFLSHAHIVEKKQPVYSEIEIKLRKIMEQEFPSYR